MIICGLKMLTKEPHAAPNVRPGRSRIGVAGESPCALTRPSSSA
jgi:hypothetical protein